MIYIRKPSILTLLIGQLLFYPAMVLCGTEENFMGSGPEFQQSAYIKASNGEAFDNNAYSIDIDDNIFVVGAPYEDGDGSSENDNSLVASGAVYVFERIAGVWQQQAYLKSSNPDLLDLFGWSVSVSGDIIVVGARGEASNATGVNGNQFDNSQPQSGAAYVFKRFGNSWFQQAYLKPLAIDSFDFFGHSVAISGDTIVVGAIGESSNAIGIGGGWLDNSMLESGAAYVFTFDAGAGTWGQRAYIKPNNTDAGDLFGAQVAISGDRIVVGANGEDSAATGVNGNWFNNTDIDSGAAYVFDRAAGLWSQQAYLKASNTDAGDYFGLAVAVDTNTIVVGAILEDSQAIGVDGDETDNSATSSGAAYVFKRDAGTWQQKTYLKPSNTDAFDFFGYAVDVIGNNILIGAPNESSESSGVNGDEMNNLLQESGAVYLFTDSNGGSWNQNTYFKASNPGESDAFGLSLALTNGSVMVGAIGESSASTGINGDENDDSAQSTGAAYVFDSFVDDVVFMNGFE